MSMAGCPSFRGETSGGADGTFAVGPARSKTMAALKVAGIDQIKATVVPDIRDHQAYLAERAPAEREGFESSAGHKLFKHLYAPWPKTLGKKASRLAREENEFTHSSLVYGEVEYEPFVALLGVLLEDGLRPGGVFVDVGCGAGKAVFAAAIGHDFDKVVGIEILERLHDINADDLLPRFENHVRHEVMPESRQHCDVEFVLGDATVLDWAEARVVFANSTCFDEALMVRLADRAAALAPGAYFVTTTTALPSDRFELRWKGFMRETWGDATVFVQRRREPGEGEDAEDASVASSVNALLRGSLRNLKLNATRERAASLTAL